MRGHRRHRARRVVVAGSAAVMCARLLSGPDGRRRRQRIGSRVAWIGGRAKGVAYRLSGGHPSLAVDDNTLADRVRSNLGSLLHRLDLPRIHVMVEDHVVLLHGEVASDDDATAIEDTVVVMPGVRGVESYLHVGLLEGDTRPSEGEEHEGASSTLQALHAAARRAGAGRLSAEAVRATLVVLAERLPEGERSHLAAHLPEDVRRLMEPARRRGAVDGVRRASELVAAVLDEGQGLQEERGAYVVEAIVGRLRTLVPEEAADIGAVLPEDLRRFWLGAVAL